MILAVKNISDATYNQVAGINDLGKIVGVFQDTSSKKQHGFVAQ
jgi:probable HAF family extracellular repeat protein